MDDLDRLEQRLDNLQRDVNDLEKDNYKLRARVQDLELLTLIQYFNTIPLGAERGEILDLLRNKTADGHRISISLIDDPPYYQAKLEWMS